MAAVVADPRVTGVGMGCCAPASPVVSNRPRARKTATRGNQGSPGVLRQVEIHDVSRMVGHGFGGCRNPVAEFG